MNQGDNIVTAGCSGMAEKNTIHRRSPMTQTITPWALTMFRPVTAFKPQTSPTFTFQNV